MANKILDNYTKSRETPTTIKNKKVQVHQLARKLSQEIFTLIQAYGIHGETVDIDHTEGICKYPEFSRELKSNGGDLLHTTTMWLIDVVHHNHMQENDDDDDDDDDECPVTYGSAFDTRSRGTSPPVLALHSMNLKLVFCY